MNYTHGVVWGNGRMQRKEENISSAVSGLLFLDNTDVLTELPTNDQYHGLNVCVPSKFMC